MPPEPIRIGQLRWPVTLFDRIQTAQASDVGIDETEANGVTVHADIQPVGDMVFYASQTAAGVTNAASETAITHRIIVRFQNYPATTKAVRRVISLPGGGTRTDVFRVLRTREAEGRKRFVIISAALEQAALA